MHRVVSSGYFIFLKKIHGLSKTSGSQILVYVVTVSFLFLLVQNKQKTNKQRVKITDETAEFTHFHRFRISDHLKRISLILPQISVSLVVARVSASHNGDF